MAENFAYLFDELTRMLILWHRRLGHYSIGRLKKTTKSTTSVDEIPLLEDMTYVTNRTASSSIPASETPQQRYQDSFLGTKTEMKQSSREKQIENVAESPATGGNFGNFGNKPDISHLRILGSLCTALIEQAQQRSWNHVVSRGYSLGVVVDTITM
ncbi:hypothetical protein K490DRAFT_69053 [Saccharata proteae CBS 121410]|uniref:GAG-pre-integrase domain-containing protein n=1 Tax=Saccharata proteae CBS 121410 TaxID=1314787 RepID=A0A9P4HM32_9PEZI|nr:hypothetical protein K490DRAFT_69053 [Saccharata proteae CBS 121410]